MRLDSSLRERPVDETFAVASRFMPALRISRVTDITAMDRLGLPVFASVRPRGGTLRVHAGKGLDPHGARVGALMEALEFGVAEPQRTVWAQHSVDAAAWAEQLDPTLRLADFAPRMNATPAGAGAIPAVECERLGTSDQVLLPAELIFLPFEPDGTASLFGWTSNGLASGNSLDEATLHALLEVLERDAITMNDARDDSQWVRNDDLPAPFDAFASDWRRLGIELVVRHVPNEFGLPCFQAYLHEAASGDVNLMSGTGLHVDRDIAVTRAICEAAQSRLTCIHGSREDVGGYFTKYSDWDAAVRGQREAVVLSSILDRRQSIAYDAIADLRPAVDDSLATVLERLLARLARARFDTVYRYRFEIDLDGLQCVKLVVPAASITSPPPAGSARGSCDASSAMTIERASSLGPS